MNLTDVWFKHIEAICEEYERVLVTNEEFAATIAGIINHQHSPVTGINFLVINDDPFGNIPFGQSQEGEPTHVYTIEQFDSHGASCRIRAWRKLEGTVNQQNFNPTSIYDYLSRLIKSFWKPNLRDDKSRLISLQYPETYKLIDNSLAKLAQTTGTLYAFFCDIDHFKEVNDTHGQPMGDKVILEFASIVYTLASPSAIAIHRSGDEFAVLYPAQDADDVLFLAKKIMESVAEHDFGFNDVAVRVSAGITPLIRDYEKITYKELEARAEKTLKPTKMAKQRGKARFESQQKTNLPARNDSSLNTALCIIKSCIGSPRPFESPWLNMISRYSYDLSNGREWSQIDFQANIKSLIRWIQPEIDKNINRSTLPASETGDFSPVFSILDVMLAVAHGVFRAGLLSKGNSTEEKTLEIFHDDFQQDNAYLKLVPDDLVIASFGDIESTSATWDLGGFTYSSNIEEFDAIDTRRALLIKIGHSKLTLPTHVFTDEIIVDDRPTRGGGLPDFWEATIAKLIAQVGTNANIVAVYVLGNHKYGAVTVEKLKSIEAWKVDAEQIHYKTGMSIPTINAAVDRLLGKIYFPSNEEQLVDNLADILLSSFELKPYSKPINLQREHRFLQRELNMSDMALGTYDGCRVNTAAEAFPVVLEVARKLIGDEPPLIDQAGQELIELSDFKVHLNNPKKDMIPAFYEGERESLDRYFNREFLGEDGLFGRVFKESKQLEIVLKHLTEAIANPGRQFSTRRAVLIVPHDIKPSEEFAPLGLISVRIIPRFSQHRIILNYSYTWRTVEALVGFPYSLYGSVKFSSHLTEEIRNLLEPEFARNLEMGELSYIAHSLHIFMDEHGQNIARRIVDNASF